MRQFRDEVRFVVGIDESSDFRVAFRVAGPWPPTATFYFGIEDWQHDIDGDGECERLFGLGLNVRTGQIVANSGKLLADGGQDLYSAPSGNHISPGLFSGTCLDGAPRGSRRNGLGRRKRGLQDGCIWGMQLAGDRLSFFCVVDGRHYDLGIISAADSWQIPDDGGSTSPCFARSRFGYRAVLAIAANVPYGLLRESFDTGNQDV
mmetsp:Transcript_119876/g.382691  ORF Transcript_119876/g.382691 Transcript_119876/m.382691 type:complete len:205 (-) Transcript_119876:184-798(-)